MSFAARMTDDSIHDVDPPDPSHVDDTDARLGPAADTPHTFLQDNDGRRAEVDRRQEILAEWLRAEGHEAVFLFDPDSLAWFTAGGMIGGPGWQTRRDAFLFITPKQRCLVSSNEQTARIFEEELDQLGFQSKQFPWSRSSSEIIAELRGGRNLPADLPGLGLLDRAAAIARLRSSLTLFDRKRYHTLAGFVAHAVEATCRAIRPAELQWEIAAHLSHRLLHHGIEPVEIHVLGNPEAQPYPRPGHRKAPIGDSCSILATARCRGLYVTTSRSISFGPPSPAFQQAHRVATLVCGTLVRFSQAGESVGSVVRKGMRIYQKYGAEFGWLDAAQGRFAGYSIGQRPLVPDTDELLEAGQAIAWAPSCHGIVSAETVIVGSNAPLPMVHFEDWPTVGVEIHGSVIPRPDILIRDR